MNIYMLVEWKSQLIHAVYIVRCKFQKRGSVKAIEAFCVKSRYPEGHVLRKFHTTIYK